MVKTNSESETKVKSESKLKKKVKAPVVQEQAVETPVVQEPVVETPVVQVQVVETPVVHQETVVDVPVVIDEVPQVNNDNVQEESNTELLFNKLINQFQDVQAVMKTLHSNLKVLQKEVLKERKESKKKESKIKKKNSKKRSPSGFAKPAPISNDLANFLNLPYGTELARTDVTSKVISYIKEHNLQNPENKKEILLDNHLNKLLVPGSDDKVTFFNLQTYLKKHFVVLQESETTSATVV
jgi:chromatin remodeling complex protein RSC6